MLTIIPLMIRLFYERLGMWLRLSFGHRVQVTNAHLSVLDQVQQPFSRRQTFSNCVPNLYDRTCVQHDPTFGSIFLATIMAEQNLNSQPPLPVGPPPMPPPLPTDSPPVSPFIGCLTPNMSVYPIQTNQVTSLLGLYQLNQQLLSRGMPFMSQCRAYSDSIGQNSLKREWSLPVKGKQNMPVQGWVELSIASYNILAQALLEDHVDLYSYCPREYLDWEHRKFNLLSEIAEHLPDILCMQEVQADHYENWFLPKLMDLGYSGHYVKRSGDKVDGCATFYKRDKLALDRARCVEYFIPDVPVLNRDNVGLLLLLKPANCNSDARICVATTHLLFNPKRGDVKLAQLQLLLAEIDKLAYKESTERRNKYDHKVPKALYHPVLLCGDFNALPKSKLYDFVTTGNLHYLGLPSKMISGQEKYPGSRPEMSGPITPESVGISDQCQFIDSFNYRYKLLDSKFIDTEEIEEYRRLHELEVKDKYKLHEAETPKKRSNRSPRRQSRSKKQKGVDLSDTDVVVVSDNEAQSPASARASSAALKLNDVEREDSSDECMCMDENCQRRHKQPRRRDQPSTSNHGAYTQFKMQNRLKDKACNVDSDGFETVHMKKHKIHDLHVDLKQSNHGVHKVVIPKEHVQSRASHHHELLHDQSILAQHQVVVPKEDISKHAEHFHTHATVDGTSQNSSKTSEEQAFTKSEENLRKYCSVGSGTLSHGFRFRSVYDHVQYKDGRRRSEVTTCHKRANCTVDYIFYHRGTNAAWKNPSLRLVKKFNLHTEEEMLDLGRLPQRDYSSDHTLLLASFQWKVEPYSPE